MNYGNAQTQGQTIGGKDSGDNAANIALNRLNIILERLSSAEDRLARVLTRAFGDPQIGQNAAKPGGPTAVPAGTLGAMDERLEQIDAMITEIGDRISRIDQII